MTCKTCELPQPGLRWRAEAVDEVTFPVSRNRCVNGQLQGNVAGVTATVEPVLGQAAILEDIELKALGPAVAAATSSIVAVLRVDRL